MSVLMAGIAAVQMVSDLDWNRVGMSVVAKGVAVVALMAPKLAVLTDTCSVDKSAARLGNYLADRKAALMAEM